MSSAVSAWVQDVREADFQAQVIERSKETPVVVDFWAPWCGPCRGLGPLLERLINERGGAVLLAKINIDEAPYLASLLQVQSIPLVIAFKGGKPVDEFTGALPEPDLREFLDALAPAAAPPKPESEAKAGEAREEGLEDALALEDSSPERAAAIYRKLAESQADEPKVLLGMARLALARGEEDETNRLLDRLGPGGDHKDEVERLRGLLFYRRLGRDPEAALAGSAAPAEARAGYLAGVKLACAGRYPEALARLLTAAELDKAFARERVREAMVKVFFIVGARSELADAYRSKLARVLY